jgi:hypothetical protein
MNMLQKPGPYPGHGEEPEGRIFAAPDERFQSQRIHIIPERGKDGSRVRSLDKRGPPAPETAVIVPVPEESRDEGLRNWWRNGNAKRRAAVDCGKQPFEFRYGFHRPSGLIRKGEGIKDPARRIPGRAFAQQDEAPDDSAAHMHVCIAAIGMLEPVQEADGRFIVRHWFIQQPV